MIDPIEATKEKMVLACKVLQKQRVLDGYGHLTARLPDGRILSTPHMPPGKVALRDLIIIDKEGNKLEGLGEPNGETAMHTSIYKARSDVQCILHYHPDDLDSFAGSRHRHQLIGMVVKNALHVGLCFVDRSVHGRFAVGFAEAFELISLLIDDNQIAQCDFARRHMRRAQ